jgi:hypothetical protein
VPRSAPVFGWLYEPLPDRIMARVTGGFLIEAEIDFKLRLRFAGAEFKEIQGVSISSCAVSGIFRVL